MIRYSIIIGFLIFLNGATGVYDFSVPRIEGGTQQLSTYQGKMILIVTLPIQENESADSMLYSLDTLASNHQPALAVVAVPALEDGYNTEIKSSLYQWYRSKLGTYVTITDGVSTRKTSGSQQHPLFSWLTKVAENGSFEQDVTGPGFKFIIDETGKLYAVLGSGIKIHGSSIQKVIRRL